MKLIVTLLVLSSISACVTIPPSGAYVVSRNEHQIPVSKLSSVRVYWVANPSAPLKMSKLVRTQHSLSDQEKASLISYEEKVQGSQYMRQLLSYFAAQAVPKIRSQMAKNNVGDGGDVALEISPLSVWCNVPCLGGREIFLLATIRQTGSMGGTWSVKMLSNGPKEFTNEMLLDNYVSTLMVELKTAGWLANNEGLKRLPTFKELTGVDVKS